MQKISSSTISSVHESMLNSPVISNITNKSSNISTSTTDTSATKGFYKEGGSIGEYKIQKTIGKGSSAKVFLCVSKTGKRVAIKVINRNNNIVNRTRILREIVIGTLLNHPHIVKVIDFFYDSVYFYIVFEYVDGIVLYDKILDSHLNKSEPLPIEKARKYFRQITSAIDYLHKNSIVHRDLKIENIIIDTDDNVKIIDFGLSNFFDSRAVLDTFCGSLYFAAPELLMGKRYNGPEIDIWSLGVVLYVMVYGKVPFDDESIHELQAKIKTCKFNFPKNRKTNPDLEDLIINMILLNPNQRYSMEDVKSSKWINEGYNEKIKNYFIKRHPINKINKDFLLILENITSYQFDSVEDEMCKYIDICKNGNKLERKYWESKPIVSLYCLLVENLTQSKGKFIDNSNKIYWETSPIIDYLNSENSNIKCIKEFLSFISESKEPLNDNNSTLYKQNSVYPLVRRSFLKGILKGIKVTKINESKLKQKLIRIFIKHNISYEANEKSYFCSLYKESSFVQFRLSIYYNVVLGEYYLTLKNLNKRQDLFNEIFAVLKRELTSE
ncbi:KIN1 [Hepatospora eriocheir]|uniref:KIN1 n=1 Tax=Hepatospora eriocheir TaxID=1081669 RepID=A0A1X0QLB6_9MICR|nr:KIN1 [Hepatospora eriocheir]